METERLATIAVDCGFRVPDVRTANLRHAGLDPASTFFLDLSQKQMDPDQVRDDDPR